MLTSGSSARNGGIGFSLVVLSMWVAGCGGGTTADQALDSRLAETGSKRQAIAKFSGTVTIDHAPPALKPDELLMVMLYDPKNPPQGKRPPASVSCDREGHFEFSTYTRGDGVAPGVYKVLFAAFKVSPLRGFSRSPDLLKNLYNDPDTSKFDADITEPGKSNWAFDLEVSGREANTSPGPHAITRLVK
jgi:hypothetical protein